LGTTSLTIPSGTATGIYYIIVKADGPDLITETSETNNTRMAFIVIGPDLVVSSFTVPSVAKAGGNINVTDTTQNNGGGDAPASMTNFYLSTDVFLDEGDIKLKGRSVPALAAGASSTGTTSLTIPSGTAMGIYYIIATADGPDLITETSETNNTRMAFIVIGPDLVVSSFTVPSVAKAGGNINVTDTTQNTGGGDAPASMTNFYLSTDVFLDEGDIKLKGRSVPALAAGASSTGTTSLTIPSGTATGIYYIIAKADGPDLITEASETNNRRIVSITIGH
jgi:trimeric autotransporter adhesin